MMSVAIMTIFSSY